MKKNSFLKAKTVPVDQLNSAQIQEMHNLMTQYYEQVPLDRFKRDLMEKNHVILLIEKKTKTIQGFSTLLKIRLDSYRFQTCGILSGDTVVARPYWGQRVLGIAFLRYLFFEKLKRPFLPYYWFLAAKGYRPYLMMANNFPNHYPRFERKTPKKIRRVMMRLYSKLYGENYDHRHGVIEHGEGSSRLRSSAAAPTEMLLNENKRVAYFEMLNPNWREGAELACVAEMTLTMPLYYSFKTFIKVGLWAQLKSLLQHKPLRTKAGNETP